MFCRITMACLAGSRNLQKLIQMRFSKEINGGVINKNSLFTWSLMAVHELVGYALNNVLNGPTCVQARIKKGFYPQIECLTYKILQNKMDQFQVTARPFPTANASARGSTIFIFHIRKVYCCLVPIFNFCASCNQFLPIYKNNFL